jgi:hypothetical protein
MVHKPAEDAANRRDDQDAGSPYVLISRGSDGRLRTERFNTLDAYRVRLATVGSNDGSVPVEELCDLLERGR